jgi:hypothetical protein
MESKINDIRTLLCQKSSVKQKVFRLTQDIFRDLKLVLRDVEAELQKNLSDDAPFVEVKYSDKGDFEAHLKFSGDTLVIMMHTNVFDFDQNHFISKTKYVQEDFMREFCGMIQVYNFLSDSIKYNRDQDLGYLIARIFINKERHFFVDGKRPISLVFNDFEKNVIDRESMHKIIEEAMLYCLNFDLMAPPVDAINYITVEQKNIMNHSSGMPTGKRLGFTMQRDEDFEASY